MEKTIRGKKRDLSKTILVLLLAVLLLTSFTLVGCNKSNVDNKHEVSSTNEASTDAPKDTEQEEETELEPVTLTWYQIGTPQNAKDMVFEAISEITKEKINATIEMELYDWGEYNQKMQVIVGSGQPHDINFTCSWANDYRTNALRGAFYGLNDLLAEYGQGILEVLDPKFIEGATINGELYAIPVNKEVAAQAVWNINKDIADKYNLDYSTLENVNDIDALEPFLAAVKAGEDDNFVPLNAEGSWLTTILPFDIIVNKFGVYFDSTNNSNNPSDIKVINILDTPEMRKYVKTMHDYYKKGYIRKDIVTNRDSTNIDKLGTWLISAYHYAPYTEVLDSIGKGYPLDVVPVQKPYTATWSATGAMHGISITSANPERAMMFLNLLNTDADVREMVNSGIEGVHYTVDENNYKVRTQEGLDNYNVPDWALGNMFITLLNEGEPNDKWKAYKEFNDVAVQTPTLGFWLDSTEISNELSALNNISEEFDYMLFNGTVDPDEYLQKYIDKMNDAGAQKVIAEIQSQIDEWVAQK